MTNGNEYRGKTKLGIIAALCAVFSIWLAVASKTVLTALVMITLAVFLFIGSGRQNIFLSYFNLQEDFLPQQRLHRLC